MAASDVVVAGWARSAVVPHGGAFAQLQPHQIAAPVVQGMLGRLGLGPEAIDAVVLGNALRLRSFKAPMAEAAA